MRCLVLTHQYPKKEDLYRSGFVHQRVKEYKKKNLNTEVWVLDNKKTKVEKYIFEGVTVYEGNQEDFLKVINKSNSDISSILVHFLLKPIILCLNNLKIDIPVLVWVHLYEASSWHRRMYEFNRLGFIKVIKSNIQQLREFKRFNENTKLNVTYIFVSNWIKKIAEKDIKTKFKNYRIIHNYINEELFSYSVKDEEKRKKILSIRTFQSKKYANDISAKVIKILSKSEEFKDMQFDIYGKGKYFKKIQKELSAYPNVTLYNKFLTQKEIATLQNNYGIFLCPTRQDSQGVSMCEAMASGLVPVSSNNTAIPEFVENKRSGLLGNNSKEIAESIRFLYNNPKKFTTLSYGASKHIRKQCGYTATVQREIDLIIDTCKFNI